MGKAALPPLVESTRDAGSQEDHQPDVGRPHDERL
jgi:hypothetical protein